MRRRCKQFVWRVLALACVLAVSFADFMPLAKAANNPTEGTVRFVVWDLAERSSDLRESSFQNMSMFIAGKAQETVPMLTSLFSLK